MRCTCEVTEFDRRTCPAHTLERQVALRSEESGVDPSSEEAWDVPLFPGRDGGIPSKEAVVQAGCSLVPAGAPRPAGHSGRRAGAKFYARRGWSALATLHLGRRSTSTVMAYVEEALAELPGGRQLSEDLPPLVDRLEPAEKHLAELAKVLDSKGGSWLRAATWPSRRARIARRRRQRIWSRSRRRGQPGARATAWRRGSPGPRPGLGARRAGGIFARRSSNWRLAAFPN